MPRCGVVRRTGKEAHNDTCWLRLQEQQLKVIEEKQVRRAVPEDLELVPDLIGGV